MFAVTALQHISLGLLVLLLLPLAPPRWLISYGMGLVILFLAAGFGQMLLGILKSDDLSAVQMGWCVGGASALFISGLWWMLRKRPNRGQTI
jgi:hypothetical protein